MENRSGEGADITNVERLRKGGILAEPHKLTPEDKKVIESLSSTEINAWLSINEKLSYASVQERHAKFFI